MRARKQLREGGIETPDLDADVLLSYVTGLDRAGLYREWKRVLTEKEGALFLDCVGRRLAGEPVAYITGNKEFMGLAFAVNPSVLIPRAETELLVEEALKCLSPVPIIVDVGTGSGAIAVSLAFLRPGALVYATDCSPRALDVARHNAARHGAGERIYFFEGDLLEPLKGHIRAGQVDLIVANLPYVAENDIPVLPRGVKLFEPLEALNGGPGGLRLYRRLIPEAGIFLKPGGFLLMEIGHCQGQEVISLLDPLLWKTVVLKDLSGLDRLALARFKGV